jgi:hypothetical protein
MRDDVKKVLLAILILAITLGVALIFVFRDTKKITKEKNPPMIIDTESRDENGNEIENLIESSRLIGGLPSSDERVGLAFSSQYNGVLVEYVSFLDFYKKTNDNLDLKISNYNLPLNIKTEVTNYYDLSRRINLDSQIDSLNNNGFAIINNPFPKSDFYSIYDELFKQQIPVLITSDFLIYYYQQVLKKTFKEVEENIFYNNLWEINYFLYEKAKIRYEESLRRVGNVNDRVLEAQRLAVAYFATSLELLKPTSGQINVNNEIGKTDLFSPFEANNYSFVLPSYLKVDVEKEVSLIRGYNVIAKSPVLLYERDYKNFIVPEEYKGQAKLNNFYLTSKWLSSNFPLYHKDQDCPQCDLDFDDWRVSFISSAFIARDIFDSAELKVSWARIYKTLAFFKGLRGDLTYVHYRDSLINSFGEDYKIEDVFADNNSSAVDNLYKFRNEILKYEFLDIEGGFDKGNINERDKMGVKMLTDFYWPNDYIFNQLSYPYVMEYRGLDVSKNNITACNIRKQIDKARCNGFSLDIIALINDRILAGNSYYLENSNYKNYQEELYFLKSQIEKLPGIWHYNNYWKNLNIIKEYLNNDKRKMPVFAQNSSWVNKELSTAIGAWVNLQLPLDKLSVYQKYQSRAIVLDEKFFWDYNYIEPNLDLVNEQLANVNMILDMFKLLRITNELRSVSNNLEELKSNLNKAKEIMIKELNSEDLSEDDLQFISMLSLEFKVDQAGAKNLKIEGENSAINYDISKAKLLILASLNKGKVSFSVGPIFSYNEYK